MSRRGDLRLAAGSGLVDGAMRGFEFMERQQDRKQHRADQEQARGLREVEAERRGELHDQRMQSARLQHSLLEGEAEQMANRAMAMSLAGNLDADPTVQQLVAENPALDARRMMTPEARRARESLQKVMDGELHYRSPEAIEALEFLEPDIQRGATDGRKVRLKDVVPGKTKGTVALGLSVEGDDKMRPLTQNRSADDNDPVAEIPVEKLMERAMAFTQYYDMVNSPEGRQQFVQTYAPDMIGRSGRWEDPYVEHGVIMQRGPDGRVHRVGDARDGTGAAGKDPAKIKAADAYIARIKAEGGEPPSFEDAFRIANTAMGDPLNFIGQTVRAEMERQSAYGIQPGDEDYRTREQIVNDAIKTVSQIRNAMQEQPGRMSRENRTILDNMDEAIKQAGQDAQEPQVDWNMFLDHTEGAAAADPASAEQGASPEEPRGPALRPGEEGFTDQGLGRRIRGAAGAAFADPAKEAGQRIAEGARNIHSKAAATQAYDKYSRVQRRSDENIPLDVLKAYLPHAPEEKRQELADLIARREAQESAQLASR